MAAGTFDRMTINFTNQKEIDLAARFRVMVGYRNVNKVLKELVKKYITYKKRKG